MRQFGKHTHVETVDLPKRGQRVRVWLRSDNLIQPQILEGQVALVVHDDGRLIALWVTTPDGLAQQVAASEIGTIEVA